MVVKNGDEIYRGRIRKKSLKQTQKSLKKNQARDAPKIFRIRILQFAARKSSQKNPEDLHRLQTLCVGYIYQVIQKKPFYPPSWRSLSP